jgi:UDP-N-acetylglucosamine 2-epimerase (non-hydrolysing)
MIDTLLKHHEKSEQSGILEKLGYGKNGSTGTNELKSEHAVLTLHRPSNVDDRDTLSRILDALTAVSHNIPIVFPVHPRTKKQIELFGLDDNIIFHDLNSENKVKLERAVNCIESLGYLDFLKLLANAKFVLTDSGGIQEETTILGIPCLTLRDNTERPVTVHEGTNQLVGTDREKIIAESVNILNRRNNNAVTPRLWDGKAAQRIVQILKEIL